MADSTDTKPETAQPQNKPSGRSAALSTTKKMLASGGAALGAKVVYEVGSAGVRYIRGRGQGQETARAARSGGRSNGRFGRR